MFLDQKFKIYMGRGAECPKGGGDISELASKRRFCQHGRQIAEGGWIKNAFVSVCGNLQHK